MINNKFLKWYKKHILLDLSKNYKEEIFFENDYYNISHGVYENIPIDIKCRAYHVLFKFLCSTYPKNSKGKPLPFKNINNSEFVLFIEEIRAIMCDNSFTFKVDEYEYYEDITRVNLVQRYKKQNKNQILLGF